MFHLHNHPSAALTRIALLVLLVCSLAAPAYAVTFAPQQFTPNDPISGKPVGFTYAGNKFVGTILGNGTGKIYSTDLAGQNPVVFGGAAFLANGHGDEHYIAASLGLGSFPLYDLYVASGTDIQHLDNAGNIVSAAFIDPTTPLTGLVRGITFDAVGTFNNRMIVTTDAGNVYSVKPSGVAQLIASFPGEDVEGLDIAPTGPGAIWGTKDGYLFVASESAGKIHSISPGTFVTADEFTGLTSPEQLDFVPLNLGVGGLEGMYTAVFDLSNPAYVEKIPGSQFLASSLQGHMIVTSELSPYSIFDIKPGNVGPAGNFPLQPEDGLFVTAAMIASAPEPASLGLLGLGSLMILTRRRHRA